MIKLLPLSDFLNMFESLGKAHINIWDFSGTLSHQLLKLEIEQRIHSKPFCSIAKSTPRGYRTCMRCKNIANRKAISCQKLFYGHCPYGLFEIGLPIVENGKTLAVIYVGNLVTEREFSLKRAEKTCKATGVDVNALDRELDNAQAAADIKPYLTVAEALSSYIRLVLSSVPRVNTQSEPHWLIREMKLYAGENFRDPLQLKDVARLYGFHEKYIGRLFKSSTDVSFTQYVNNLRLNAAETELLSSDKSIIEISVDCGFENVTYFNRLFKARHGISPGRFKTEGR